MKQIVDRENFTECVVVVKASDAGEPPRETTTAVVVTLKDVNDNYPRFVSQRNIFVMEVG